VPADTDALAVLPLGDTGTQFIDDARDFMSWDAGILNSGPAALFRQHVTVANTTGLDLDAHLSYTRLGNLALNDLKISSGTGNLCHLHSSDRCCCRYHKSSYDSLSYKCVL
jgi:hypothetical protein